MHVRPRKGEAHEDGAGTERSLELVHDRDRPAFAGQHGRAAVDLLQGLPRGFEERPFRMGAPGSTAVKGHEIHRDARARDPLQVSGEEPSDLCGVLVGDQPKAHLRHGRGRQDGLGSLPTIAGHDPVHLAGWADPEPLEGGKACLPLEGPGAGLFQKPRLVEGKPGDAGASLLIPIADRVVEPGDGDATIGVVEGGEQMCQLGSCIRDGAAIGP